MARTIKLQKRASDGTVFTVHDGPNGAYVAAENADGWHWQASPFRGLATVALAAAVERYERGMEQ